MIEKQQIKKYLPHREPFLFVDGVTEIIKDEYIKGFKEVKEEEFYFKGHFPDNPILPGVIIIEALAQVSGILGFVTMNKTPEEGSIYYFVGADNVRFRSPVVPPSILTLESKVKLEITTAPVPPGSSLISAFDVDAIMLSLKVKLSIVVVPLKVLLPVTVIEDKVVAPVTPNVDPNVTAPVISEAPDTFNAPSFITFSLMLTVVLSTALIEVPESKPIPANTTFPVPLGINLISSLDLIPLILLPSILIACLLYTSDAADE